jgi:hypothetical protein
LDLIEELKNKGELEKEFQRKFFKYYLFHRDFKESYTYMINEYREDVRLNIFENLKEEGVILESF